MKLPWFKFLLGWVICTIIWVLPYRPLALEPVTSAMLPYAERYKALGGFIFAFFAFFIINVLFGTVNSWAWLYSLVYGGLGAGAGYYLRRFGYSRASVVTYAVIASLIFDFLIGLLVGPLYFHQSFLQTLRGLAPYGAVHLVSNVILTLTLTPLLRRWVLAVPVPTKNSGSEAGMS